MKCPIRGVGAKECIKDCALYTPLGCAIKVLADQAILNNRPAPKKEKKEGK